VAFGVLDQLQVCASQAESPGHASNCVFLVSLHIQKQQACCQHFMTKLSPCSIPQQKYSSHHFCLHAGHHATMHLA